MCLDDWVCFLLAMFENMHGKDIRTLKDLKHCVPENIECVYLLSVFKQFM